MKTLCSELKDLEVVLKRKDREREGEEAGECQHYFGVPAWPDFEKRILIASVGWR